MKRYPLGTQVIYCDDNGDVANHNILKVVGFNEEERPFYLCEDATGLTLSLLPRRVRPIEYTSQASH
ncbi:MAG: hypothetical protein HQL32_07635 [Planctomycetes bacterium]|nr:hypothetical protein [Planctomycetota bacterium]